MGCSQSLSQIKPMQNRCPLGHQLEGMIQFDPKGYSQCHICTKGQRYYIKCEICNYSVCFKHLKHINICTQTNLQCYRIDYQKNERCMMCFSFIVKNMPGFICKSCNYVCCTRCRYLNHYQTAGQKQYTYIKKDQRITINSDYWNRLICFNCNKQIAGGLKCKNCNNLFCAKCQKDELAQKFKKSNNNTPNSNNTINNQCSICFVTLTTIDVIKLGCNHSFHSKCLAKWQNRSCPNCRTAF